MTPEDVFESIYVKLEDEFMVYYIPLQAKKTSDGYYVLPTDVDDSIEDWEFPPGSVVRVEHRLFANGDGMLSVERIR